MVCFTVFVGTLGFVSAQEDAPADADAEAGTSVDVFMPAIFQELEAPVISTTLPSSSNTWTVSATASDETLVTSYIIEESKDPNFGTILNSYTVDVGSASQAISHSASPDNSFYYRAKAVGDLVGSGYSNVVAAHGAYHDTFNDDTTGWEKRRFTFLEETNVYYGSGNEEGNLVVITADRWDWVLGSPFRIAPAVPYEVEYRMRVHDASNLVSGGAVIGGDWNGDACPEFGNVYATNNCFNSFYNFNMIFFGPMKLLYEQVDRLDYCPNCGGSQIKRLGSTTTVENISGLGNPATDWHNFRVTVQDDGLRFYVDDKFVRHFPDTTHIHQPYFGVFSSTDEYKPSIYLFEYYSVTPMDN